MFKVLAKWTGGKHELILSKNNTWYRLSCNEYSSNFTGLYGDDEAIKIIQSRIDAGEFRLYNGNLERVY